MSIRVALGERSYPIILQSSYRALPGALRSLALGRRGWVISHHAILQRYGRELIPTLRADGWDIRTLAIPESETSKSWDMAHRIAERISQAPSMRIPVVFALGGGVVGDVAGFVAAILRRGVPYVQLPTTLLAQVDSAIGGKVGVDLPHGKNLLGAFYQPRLVYNHLGVLQTLPARQRRSGLAEVIKYGAIADPQLFAFLERHLASCLALRQPAARLMVERSCRIKARIVSHDERETGTQRLTLNFGHTLGHALEAATHYRRWTHGEAIAIGMCAAAELSVELGMCSPATGERLKQLIVAAGLPVRALGVPREAVWRALRYDKKFVQGRPRWVLLRRIGRVAIADDIPLALTRRVLDRYSGR